MDFFTTEQKAADNIDSGSEYLHEQFHLLRSFPTFLLQTEMENFCSYMYTNCFRGVNTSRTQKAVSNIPRFVEWRCSFMIHNTQHFSQNSRLMLCSGAVDVSQRSRGA